MIRNRSRAQQTGGYLRKSCPRSDRTRRNSRRSAAPHTDLARFVYPARAADCWITDRRARRIGRAPAAAKSEEQSTITEYYAVPAPSSARLARFTIKEIPTSEGFHVSRLLAFHGSQVPPGSPEIRSNGEPVGEPNRQSVGSDARTRTGALGSCADAAGAPRKLASGAGAGADARALAGSRRSSKAERAIESAQTTRVRAQATSVAGRLSRAA